MGFYFVPYKMNFIEVNELNSDNGWEICNECYYEKVFFCSLTTQSDTHLGL